MLPKLKIDNYDYISVKGIGIVAITSCVNRKLFTTLFLFIMKLTKTCKLLVNLLNTNLKLSLKVNIRAYKIRWWNNL